LFFKSIYFIPARHEGTSQTHSKGKRVERWKNVARKLRSLGAIDYERGRKENINIPTSSHQYFSGIIVVFKKKFKYLVNLFYF